MKRNILILPLFLVLLLSACGTKKFTVMTHDSFAISDEVVVAFEEEHNVEIQFLEAGDTGTALNKAILARGNPLADVFYGVDNTFLSRAIDEDIFERYSSPLMETVDNTFKTDLFDRVSPVDFGDVCLNYEVDYFRSRNIDSPKSLDDLTKPEYEGLLVVENPATSSPGLAFLFATIGWFGEPGYLDYWGKLVENDVLVVNDWETAYYTEFSQWGGTRPIVVSYASSPAFEMIFSTEEIKEPPTRAVTANGACFRQIEYVGILKGTKNIKLAESWVDYMLSIRFQEDIPLQMYVFPVNRHATLDPTFIDHLELPNMTAQLSPTQISEQREAWIIAWTELVLR